MKHLLEVIAKALVDQPDKVTVTEKETADIPSIGIYWKTSTHIMICMVDEVAVRALSLVLRLS